MFTIVLLIGPAWIVGQDKKEETDDWLKAIIAQMPEEQRAQYEKLRKPDFAKLELVPRPLELNETPEKLNEHYKIGDKIYFRLLITNISIEKVVISDADPYYYNRPQLFRDGDPVPYRKGITELLKSKDEEFVHRRIRTAALGPDQTLTVNINLSDWYGPLEPGHYQLTVRRRFIWGGEWIESPSSSFEVDPK
jgi:hypothetical protein